VIGPLLVGILGLASIVAFIAWVVFREPWGPLRHVPVSSRAEASELRRARLVRPRQSDGEP
jgi:hypothetical protein